MLVDAYLNEEPFNLYLSKVNDGLCVRVLSNNLGPNVDAIARMLAKRTLLNLRTSTNIHDRYLFVDDRGWVIGQSVKDAAKKKPTCIVELDEPGLSILREAHDKIWHVATVVI